MREAEYAAHAALEERHWWFAGRRHVLRELLHAVAPPNAGVALLDLGCGTGGNAAAFAGEYDVLGIDPAADAIRRARARYPAVRFLETGDPEAAASHLARGGVILLADVLEHVQDDRALLRRAVAVLPAGGQVVITVPSDPSLWSQHDVDFGHFRRYEAASLSALWSDLPVAVRVLAPLNVRLRPVIAAIRRVMPGAGNNLRIPAGPLNAVLRRTFAGEAPALVAALDRAPQPRRGGVSLVAVLRKQ